MKVATQRAGVSADGDANELKVPPERRADSGEFPISDKEAWPEGIEGPTEPDDAPFSFRTGAELRFDSEEDESDEEAPVESVPPAWNRCAVDYESFAQAITRPFAEDAVRLVHLGDGSRLLDVAAGTGEFSMAAALRGATVLATDFSVHMLELLRRIGQKRSLVGITPALMDGQNLALEDDQFDVAASLFGLVFFPDPARGLAEMFRVLRPGGQTVIGTWASPARVELMRVVGEAVMQTGVVPQSNAQPSAWVRYSSHESLTRLLRGAGFDSVHSVELTHVWTFDSVEMFAAAVLRMTPAWAEFHDAMTHLERELFVRLLSEHFLSRQGGGPYAVTAQGLLAVGTKPEVRRARGDTSTKKI